MTLVPAYSQRDELIGSGILCAARYNSWVNPNRIEIAMDFSTYNTIPDWPADPLKLFADWFQHAQSTEVPEPEAMTLCSCTTDGYPSARMVLLRGFDDRGFCFYTNYNSRKGCELNDNPRVAAVFYWREPYLQVRIEGNVEKLTAAESDAYFMSRDRSKRLNAAVSSQSQPITDWRELRRSADELEKSDDPGNRPSHWGGYRIQPTRIEFWAGSQDRLHRRCNYIKSGEDWQQELLAP